MQVFVTGGTGTIGTPVVAELLAHGHSVIALARSDASALAVGAAGAEPVRGSLADLDLLHSVASAADGVVHLAFDHDMAAADSFEKHSAEEAAALRALGEALRGSGRPLVTVSGTPWIAGRPSIESDPTPTDGPVRQRGEAVQAILGLAAHGVRSSAVRIPRTAHNNGMGGFAGILTDLARRSGVAGYPGDGRQRWPAVHAVDAATLFRLALERAEPGTAWHAVADEGDAVRDIAGVIGRRLGLPVEAVPETNFGPLGPIFATDQPSSSAHTRAVLGWQPVNPSLLDDLENIAPFAESETLTEHG